MRAEQFQVADVNRRVQLQRLFELALCIEVAVPLPPQSARTLVRTLVNLAPAIVFSAAIPFQGGQHHVNEQWPDYWAALFGSYGYVMIDCFRRALWENDDIQPFIAQNLFLYVTPPILDSNTRLRQAEAPNSSFPLRAVH